MKNLFLNCGILLTDEKVEKFNKFFSLLTEYNKMFNLTSITDREEVIIKHFIDSAIGIKYINGKKILDVGAGGGFPSIPLKIMDESLNFTLLEATGKKCEFLKIVAKELDLKNVDVINARAEDLAKKEGFRESFDTVVSRAVARLNTLSEYCIPFVKKGGIFLAYKGSNVEEINEANSAVKILGGEIKKVDNYSIFDNERNLVLIEKIKLTEKKYPRGNGKERKNPL